MINLVVLTGWVLAFAFLFAGFRLIFTTPEILNSQRAALAFGCLSLSEALFFLILLEALL